MKNFIQNISWPFAYTITPKLLIGIKFLVVTRILGPKEFGEYAFVLISLSFMEGLSEFGFKQAIIQQINDLTSIEESSCRGFLAIRGFLIFCLCIGLSGIIGSYFPKLNTNQFILISTIPFIRGLYAISIAKLQRLLAYRKLFFFQLIWKSLELVISFSMIYFVSKTSFIATVSMVLGEISAVLIMFGFFDQLPKFGFRFNQIKNQIEYGKWIWGQSILTVSLNQFDKIYVISFFGKAAMGAYQALNRLLQLLITDPVNMIIGTWFPKLSKDYRANNFAAWKYFSNIIRLFFLFSAIIYSLSMIHRSFIIHLVLGKQWVIYSNLLPIFSLTTIAGSLISFFVMWYRASGNPKIIVYSTAIQAITYITLIIFIGKHHYIYGVAISVLLAALCSLIVLFFNLGFIKLKSLMISIEFIIFVFFILLGMINTQFKLNNSVHIVLQIILSIYLCFVLFNKYRELKKNV